MVKPERSSFPAAFSRSVWLGELDHDVDDVLGPDAVHGGAAYVADPPDRTVGQQLDETSLNLLVLLTPRVVMLNEEYGKELPQLFKRHVRQFFSHAFSPEQFWPQVFTF